MANTRPSYTRRQATHSCRWLSPAGRALGEMPALNSGISAGIGAGVQRALVFSTRSIARPGWPTPGGRGFHHRLIDGVIADFDHSLLQGRVQGSNSVFMPLLPCSLIFLLQSISRPRQRHRHGARRGVSRRRSPGVFALEEPQANIWRSADSAAPGAAQPIRISLECCARSDCARRVRPAPVPIRPANVADVLTRAHQVERRVDRRAVQKLGMLLTGRRAVALQHAEETVCNTSSASPACR